MCLDRRSPESSYIYLGVVSVVSFDSLSTLGVCLLSILPSKKIAKRKVRDKSAFVLLRFWYNEIIVALIFLSIHVINFMF